MFLQQLSAMAQDVAVTEYLERAKEIDQIPRDVSAEQFRRVLRVMAINKLAQTIYVPKKYEGTITLIRTQVPAGMDPCYGLEKLADAGVQVFEIKNSHHLSFINEPELARTLLRCRSSFHGKQCWRQIALAGKSPHEILQFQVSAGLCRNGCHPRHGDCNDHEM